MKWMLVLFLLGLVCSTLAQIDLADVDEEGEDDVDDDAQPVDINYQRNRKNPCNSKRCKRGETCILNDNNQARCVCREDCHTDNDPRHMVCSVKNVTFDSECHLDREYCWCKKKMPQCGEANIKKLRRDYYGECKELTRCEDFEMEQFPDRMSNWTFVVMKEMARRHQLDKDYLALLKNATADDHHTDAILWKFCSIDINPHDRKVSRRELLFIISSVKPMEHCLVPFLNRCDTNNDGLISLVEWGECLKLDRVHIEDKCKAIKNIKH